MNIEWLLTGTAARWSEEDYRDGGAVYETYVRKALGRKHKISVTYMSRGNHRSKIIRSYQFGRYILKSRRTKFRGDLVIRDLFSTVFAPFDRRRKNIVIIHHMDFSSVGYRFLYNWITKRFFRRIRLADVVVAVSQYWKQVLEEAGCPDVRVVYNSFKLESFDFSPEELEEFAAKWGIPRDKPVIYLGNARPEKGFREAFEALKKIDAVFFATGKKKSELPIFQLHLSYPDYLKSLCLCALAVTMSKFNEGWCRTAHEAMLCGTPVVGSGRGGMRELLESGGQIICENFAGLEGVVAELLPDPERRASMSAAGREFARRFSFDYFQQSWIDLIDELAPARRIIRVLHYTHNLDPYGIGSFLLNLLKTQRDCPDVRSAITYSKEQGSIQRFREAGIILHALPQRSARDARLLFAFTRLFKSFDIVVLHTYSPWAFLAGFLLDKKIVYTFHGAFGLKGRWTDVIKVGFYRRIVNRASDRMVFASPTSLDIYQNRIGRRLPPAKVDRFPFGLIISGIRPGRPREEMRAALGVSGRFVIGTVLRIDPVKKVERLVEALSCLPESDGFHLLIAGSGGSDYQNKIMVMARDRELADSISFLGYREDVFDVVNAMDFFVLPSTNETFGLALLEAMALGIPSAVFEDGGGCLDILGDAGFVVSNPRQLAETIVRLKNNDQRGDLGARSKLRAQRFDIKYTAEHFLRIYRELV